MVVALELGGITGGTEEGLRTADPARVAPGGWRTTVGLGRSSFKSVVGDCSITDSVPVAQRNRTISIRTY